MGTLLCPTLRFTLPASCLCPAGLLLLPSALPACRLGGCPGLPPRATADCRPQLLRAGTLLPGKPTLPAVSECVHAHAALGHMVCLVPSLPPSLSCLSLHRAACSACRIALRWGGATRSRTQRRWMGGWVAGCVGEWAPLAAVLPACPHTFLPALARADAFCRPLPAPYLPLPPTAAGIFFTFAADA